MLTPEELGLLDLTQQEVELPTTPGMDDEIPLGQLHRLRHLDPPICCVNALSGARRFSVVDSLGWYP